MYNCIGSHYITHDVKKSCRFSVKNVPQMSNLLSLQWEQQSEVYVDSVHMSLHSCKHSAHTEEHKIPRGTTDSGKRDPNRSLSFSLSLAPSLSFSRSLCSRMCRYLGLCLSQSRSVSQACLCSDSLVKLTAKAISAVRLSFFRSIHLGEMKTEMRKRSRGGRNERGSEK